MKSKLLPCLALVLCSGLAGCVNAPKIQGVTSMTAYDGETIVAPRKLQNGSASLKEVYAWANYMFGTNYYHNPLETIHADIFQNGGDDLFVTQPAWGGTGGNEYLAFRQTRKGYQFVGDLWFGGLQIVSPDSQGRPRLITTSWAGSGRCRTSLWFLDKNGFHEIIGRNLPCGDSAHAEGQDQLMSLLFDFETGNGKKVTEPVLQLVFGDPATIEFSGSIQAGKRFERSFGGRFSFALEPMEYGWEICVYEKGQKQNLAALTLPLHGPNPTDIEGWRFRNEENTGPSLNVADADDDREFIFSPEVGSAINGPGSTNEITEDDIDRIEAFGQGELKITHLKLSPPRMHETASILQMNFDCKLTWRRKSLEPMRPNTVSNP